MTSLRNTWAVFLRELAAFFLSPVAYVVMFLFVISNGYVFYGFCKFWQHSQYQVDLTLSSLFNYALVWIVPLSPLLTMRLFAEEKRTGTLEVLMTAPVTETQVVVGKFLAAQVFYMLIWASLLLYVLIFELLDGHPDWGPIVSVYVGLFFLGALTNSLGVLASSLSRNQLVSAVLALSVILLFVVLTIAGAAYHGAPDIQRIIHFVSITQHFSSDYSRGVVDVRYILYYLTFMMLFLFSAVRVVEARKWR